MNCCIERWGPLGGLPRSRPAAGVVLAALLVARPAALASQAATAGPVSIAWWQGAAAVAGIALLSAADEGVADYTQAQRSPSTDGLASGLRRMGQPEVFVTVPGALFLTGWVTHRPALRRAGERVAASLVLAGGLALGGKVVVGRLRPYQSAEQYDFKPFSGASAFPSGHATMAFALATALSHEIHRPWATAGLFAAATGTAWSRLNDDDHWLSDVAAGALVGIASAQFVEGRWTVFHVPPPTFLSVAGRASLGWRLPLPSE